MSRGAALITGASSGIGAELAKLCAAAGYDVVLVARRGPLLQQLAEELTRSHGVSVRIVTADLADAGAPDAIFAAVREHRVEILINNAGLGVNGPFAENDWEAEHRLLQVNLMAPTRLAKLFLPEMIQRGSGRILNVASTAAFVPGPLMALYYASKAYLYSFSLALAVETKSTGVSVTVLCPGPTHTGFAEAAGITNSRIFRGPAMTASAVALEGFNAMMAGKPEVIAGASNRWMIFGSRFVPRILLARLARNLNSSVQ